MISDYKYFGYKKDGKGNTRVWGACGWVDNDWMMNGHYIFWGSSKNPMIKEFRHAGKSKKERLFYRINERRKGYGGYTELKGPNILDEFPEMDKHIEMHVLAKMLRAK